MDPATFYEKRAETADLAAATLESRARRLSWARLAAAAAIVAIIYYGNTGLAAAIAWPVGIVALLVFAALVRVHRRTAASAAHERSTAAACRAGIARISRDWPAIPTARISRTSTGRSATAIDLDLLGNTSLFQLLDVSAAAIGGARVVEWLITNPPALDVIRERQASVGELRQRPAFLLEAAIIGRHGNYVRSAADAGALQTFVSWSGRQLEPGEQWTGRARTAIAIAVLLVIVAAWHGAGALPVAIVLIIVQLTIAAMARKQLHSMLKGLDTVVPQLRGLDASMQLIAGEADVPGAFGAVQQVLRSQAAATSLARLDTVLRWNDVHLAPMMHFPLNALFAADVHIAAALERWRAQSGIRMADWVDLASNAQALTALATLGYENPAWTMPVVTDNDAAAFNADDVTHPLLSPATAVANPVRIAEPGSLLALSGSNMAGKTTYLRAIGLNAVLALAGGPVSAATATIRRARVRTSVRIEDDLGAGVSLFLAEVTRLRDIVRDGEEPGQPPVLFLFDEILHGTNAADRRYASQVILRRLLEHGNSGLLTTHDADLVSDLFDASATVRSADVQQGHFRESVERDEHGVRMSFDYILRRGPTTSANARVILEMMGLNAAEYPNIA